MTDNKKGTDVKSSYDVVARSFTFVLSTGEIFTRTLSEADIAGLSELQIEKILYAEQKKVRTTLSPVPVDQKGAKIAQEIADLEAGKFVTRSQPTNHTLSSFFKAFALINSTGVVNTGNGTLIPVPPSSIVVGELRTDWADLSSPATVVSVLSYWDNLDKKVKSDLRKDTFIKFQEQMIVDGALAV